MTNVQAYITVFDADGKRITSYCPEVHGGDLESLRIKAEEQYPDGTVIQTTPEDNARYVSGYTYDSASGKPVAPPEPTAEDLRQSALTTLDAQYQSLFADLDNQIVMATALGDDGFKADLLAERTALVSEYTTKRGEI